VAPEKRTLMDKKFHETGENGVLEGVEG
jgi:hypothetical protein